MSVAANRYAKALIDVLPVDKAEAADSQLSALSALLREQPDARRLFENPTVSTDRRKGLMKEIARALGFSQPVQNFVEILIERNRLNLLDEISKVYRKYLDDKQGIIRAAVTTAQQLEPQQRDELAAKLEKLAGKRVRLEVSVDPALLGGLVARVGSTIYDGSIRQQLQSFKARLAQE